MIEPAGYGAAVLFGPGVWNFQDTVDHLLACGGAAQVATPQGLAQVVRRLACDSLLRSQLGAAARRFVFSQQGATAKTVTILDQLLGQPRAVLEQAA